MPKRRLFTRRNSQKIRVFVRKNKANIIGLLVLSVIFAGIILTLNYYSLTGLYFLEQREALKSPVNVSSDAVIDLELIGSPSSLSLSGYLLGDGAVRVYLANTGSLVLDSSSLANLQFSDVCGEACMLENVSAEVELFAEVNGSATLVLDSVRYTVLNRIPSWTGKTSFVLANNSRLSVNLNLFAEDLDGDELVYSATSNEEIEAALNGSVLVLTQKNGFEGKSSITIVVSDMKETVRQDIAIETALISAREQEILNLPMQLDSEVFDEMEFIGSSDVIIQLKDKYHFRDSALNQLAKLEVEEFKSSLNLEKAADFGISQNADGEILREFDSLNSLALKMTNSGFEKIKQNPLVAGIFIDKKFEVNLQDSIPLIKADSEELQNLNSREPVSVCVLDTGIDYKHEWFKDGVLGGYNAFANSTNAADDNNHGTHVSGIVRAVSNAKIVPVKVCDASGICKASDVLAGIDYCINNKGNYNIQVISGSFGDGLEHLPDCAGVLDSALSHTNQLGIVSVFASGNEGYKNGVNYPACSKLTISAGSTSKNGTISPFTNLPADVLAPGENINSSIINGYGVMSGTSMASAHVAGTAAILKAYSPALAQDGVNALLGSSTSYVNSYPLLNSYNSYKSLTEDSANTSEFKIAATSITACGTTVSTPGDYEVTGYLSTSGTTDCVTITKSNVSIDCLGNHIVSTGTGQAFETGTATLNNITIKNCFISGFNQGVFGTGSLGNLSVFNTTFNGTKVDGMDVDIWDSNISYNTFQYLPTATGYLIEFEGDRNKIINNTAKEFKSRGIYISSQSSAGQYNNISDNYIDMKNSSQSAIILSAANINYFYNNTIVNVSGASFGFDLSSVENEGDNLLLGLNLINGTDVSERWIYNKDNYTIEGKNYYEQNFFDVASVIIRTVKNLTIKASNFTNFAGTVTVAGYGANVHLYAVQNATIQNSLFNNSINQHLILEEVGNITIRDSIFSEADKAGIYTYDTVSTAYGADRLFVFASNFTSNTGYDIYSYSDALENTLVGNRFTGSAGTRVQIGYAISGTFYSIDSLNVTDNLFSATGGIMIDVQGSNLGYIKYNNLTGTTDGIRLYAIAGSLYRATNTIVEYNNITGLGATSSAGVIVMGSDNTIMNNNISYFEYGIEFDNDPKDNNVTANNITHSLSYGIYFETDGSTTTSHKNYVSKNVIRGVNDQHHYYKFTNVTLENLNIDENKTVYPSLIMAVDSINVTVRHNNITTNNSAAGIWLTNVSHSHVWNNTVRNATEGIVLYGIGAATNAGMSNVTIIRNNLFGIKNYGIYDIGNAFNKNITMHNNTLVWGNGTSGKYGIYLADAATALGNYNISANNITKGWDYGIYDSGVDYNLIQNNYIDDIRTDGIYITGQNNTLFNNTLKNIDDVPASNAIEVSGAGAKYNQISYNYIENASTGIRWSTTAENNSAFNNTIYNSSRTGLYFVTTSKQQKVYQNTICHNRVGINYTGTAINDSGLDIRKNYFCIQNLYPADSTTILETLPRFAFNLTNLLNRSTTNCTAFVDGAANGVNNTQLGVNHANQTIQAVDVISSGSHSLNFSCQDNFENTVLVNSITFTAPNTPPTIPIINITSTDPLNRTNGTLIGEHTYNDVEGDAWVYNETSWYNNTIEVPELKNRTTIADGNTTKGQSWTYSARVFDGTDWSSWYNSSGLTINNSVPEHTIPVLNSTDNLNRTNGTLQCFNQTTKDIDNDAVTNRIQWFNNTILTPELENSTTVSSANTTKGQQWLCQILPNDGTNYGVALNSTVLTIANAALIPDEITAPKAGSLQTSFRFENVTWLAFGDLDSDLDFYNVTLRYTNYTLHTIINVSTNNLYTPINYSNFGRGNYTMMVMGCDTGGLCSNSTANFSIDRLPIHTMPVLNSTTSANDTYGNLTVYNQSTFDSDNDTIKNIINWYVNNKSLMVLNMPFEGGSQSGNATGVPNATRDYSPYQNNGTAYNAVYNATGGYDGKGAYQFDGVDDYINLPLINDLTWTYIFWFKTSDLIGWENILGRQFANNYGWTVHVQQGSNLLVIRIDTNASTNQLIASTSTVREGVWHSGAININDTNKAVKVYVDGNLEKTGSYTGSFVSNSGGNMYLARPLIGTNQYFNGSIDEVMIFNYSLSAAQIKALYENRTDTIVAAETNLDDVWYAEITPNDGAADGATLASNNLTITQACGMSVPESVTLTRNLSINNGGCIEIKTNNVTFNCSGYWLISNGSNTGILLNYTAGVRIENCVVYNFSYGMLLNRANHSVLLNNTALNNSNYGFYLNNSHYNNLTQNKARNTTQSLVTGSGIYIFNSNYNNLTDNRAEGNKLYGFELQSSNYSLITNNIAIENSNYAGFYLLSSSNNTLTNNHPSYNRDGFVIYLSNNNTLTSNTANYSSRYGFYLLDAHNNSLRQNTAFNNTDTGIYLYTARQNLLTQNKAANNTNYGIALDSSNANILTHNRADNNTGSGLYLSAVGSANLTNNTASNNRFGFNVQSSSYNIQMHNNTGLSNILADINVTQTSASNSPGIVLKDSVFNSYEFRGAELSIENSSAGKIDFLNRNIINETGDNLMVDIRITQNRIFVNTSTQPGFNVTANLTFYRIYNTTPMPIVDIEDDNTFAYCTFCTNLSYTNNDSFIYNVTHFTTFSSSENIAPTIPIINITSTDPLNRTNGTLIGQHTYNDVDGDAWIYNETKWYNNTIELTELRNKTTVASGNTTKGQNWTYSARVFDGTEWSGWYNSSSLTINNSVPEHTIPLLNSTDNLNRTNGTLQCFNQTTKDIDNDAVTNRIQWFNNTILTPELENSTTVSSANTTKGQQWLCQILPNDGTNYGIALNSTTLTITNTAPEVTTPIISPTAPYDSEDLKTNITYTDSDADSGTVYFKWWKGSTLIITQSVSPVANGSIATTTLDKSYLSANDIIIVEAWANDSSLDSTHKNSSSVTVLATPAPVVTVPGAGGGGIVAPAYYPPYIPPAAPLQLLDVILLYADSPIESGDFLDFSYFIKAMSKISGDINIEYWLEPANNRERVIEGKSVVYFNDYEGKILDSKMYLPKSLKGLYNLYLQATFGDYSVEAQTVIEVVEEAPTKVGISYLDEEFKKEEHKVNFVFLVSSNKDYQVPVTIKEFLAKGDATVWQNNRDIMLTKSQKFQDSVQELVPGDYTLKIAVILGSREESFIIRNFNIPEKPRIEQPQPVKIARIRIIVPIAGAAGLLVIVIILLFVVSEFKKRDSRLYQRVEANLAKIGFMKTMPYLMVDLASVKNGKETVNYLIEFYLRFKTAIESKNKDLIDKYKANEEKLGSHIAFLNNKIMQLPSSPYTTQRDECNLLKTYIKSRYKKTKNRHFKDITLDLNSKKKVQLNQARLIIPKKSFY